MGASVSASVAPPASSFVFPRSATTPNYETGERQFDPNYGFPDGKRRKEKVMKVTEEEMVSCKIPKNLRNYCADKLIQYEMCKRNEFPFLNRCHHAKHDYDTCCVEEMTNSMKEYERERRLLYRKQKKERMNQAS